MNYIIVTSIVSYVRGFGVLGLDRNRQLNKGIKLREDKNGGADGN